MRLRLDLAYDGGAFHGWAAQTGLRTVEGELAAALAMVLRTDSIALTCAGRTDAGVHARGQVAHVDLADPADPDNPALDEHLGDLTRLTRRLNGVLDDDVRVRRCTLAPPGFDARFSAVWRRYAYRIADRTESVDPLRRSHVLAWPRALDEAAMATAAAGLLGEHDFAAYCKRREGATTIRTLLDLDVRRDRGGRVVVGVRADAFCHHMVRSLVGALVAVGEGRRTTDWPAAVLAAAVRDPAVTVLPARGLTLEEVGYPADSELEAQAVRSRVRRSL